MDSGAKMKEENYGGIGDVLASKIFTHEQHEDCMDEIVFEKPCMLRQMIVSAVPTGHVEDSKEAKLNVFVKDIKCGTSSRFVCVYEGLEQPVSGSIMISLENVVTNHVVVRGVYQTMPLKIYGFEFENLDEPIPPRESKYFRLNEEDLEKLDMKLATLEVPNVNGDHITWNCTQKQDMVDAGRALDAVLAYWKGKSKYDAINTINEELTMLKNLSDGLCRDFSQRGIEAPCSTSWSCEDGLLVDMVMEWLAKLPFAMDNRNNITPEMVSLADIALRSLLVGCAAHDKIGEEFIERNGMLVLLHFLEMKDLPISFLKLGISICCCLVQQKDVLACEAILGWYRLDRICWLRAAKDNEPIPQVDGPGDRRHRFENRQRVESSRSSKHRGEKRERSPARVTMVVNDRPVDMRGDVRLKASLTSRGNKDKNSRPREHVSKRLRMPDTQDGLKVGDTQCVEVKRTERKAEAAKNARDTVKKKAENETTITKKPRSDRIIQEKDPKSLLKDCDQRELMQEAREKVLMSKYWNRVVSSTKSCMYDVLSTLFEMLQPKEVIDLAAILFSHIHCYREIVFACELGGEISTEGVDTEKRLKASMRLIESFEYIKLKIDRASSVQAGTDKPYTVLKDMRWENEKKFIFVMAEKLSLMTSLNQACSSCCTATHDDFTSSSKQQQIVGNLVHAVCLLVFSVLSQPSLWQLIPKWGIYKSLLDLKAIIATAPKDGIISRQGRSAELESSLTGIQSIPMVTSTLEALLYRDLCSKDMLSALRVLQVLLNDSVARDLLVSCSLNRADSIFRRCGEIVRIYIQFLGIRSDANALAFDDFCWVLDYGPLYRAGVDLLSAILSKRSAGNILCWIPHALPCHEILDDCLKHLVVDVNSNPLINGYELGKIHGSLSVFPLVIDGGIEKVLQVLDTLLPVLHSRDNRKLPMDEDEYFHVSKALNYGNPVLIDMEWDQIRLLIDNAHIFGQLSASILVLNGYLKCSENSLDHIIVTNGCSLIARVLILATEMFSASQADYEWAHRAGSSFEPFSSRINRLAAIDLFSIASETVLLFVQKMDGQTKVSSISLVQGLLLAHAALCTYPNILNEDIKREIKHVLSEEEQHLAECRTKLVRSMQRWIEAPKWEPKILTTAFCGPMAAPLPERMECTSSFAPAQMLSLGMLLGDLFPQEWPSLGGENMLSEAERGYRAALTEEIEGCASQFEHLLNSFMTSECSILHIALVRIIAKGAGLGGGMGTYLIGILSSGLEACLVSSSLLYETRKVMEVLVPLLYHPAMKSAALDSSVPAILSRLIGEIIDMSTDTEGKHGEFEPENATSILTMILECLTILCNPSITLDLVNSGNASSADTFRPGSGALVASILFDRITALGVNIPLVLNIFTIMVQTLPGRESMRKGIVRLFSKTQGLEIRDPTPQHMMTAVQWLVTQYRNLQSQVEDEGIKAIFSNLEHILKEMCLHMDSDLCMPELEPPPPAPVRFAALVKLLVERDGDSIGHSTSYIDISKFEGTKECDAVQLFWKNRQTRAVSINRAASLRKFVRWEVSGKYTNFCVAGLMHPWLTHPTRLLNESMRPKKEYHHGETGDIQGASDVEIPASVAPFLDEEDAGVNEAVLASQVEEKPSMPQIHIPLPEIPDIAPEPGSNVAEEDEGLDLYADLYPGVTGTNDTEEGVEAQPAETKETLADKEGTKMEHDEEMKEPDEEKQATLHEIKMEDNVAGELCTLNEGQVEKVEDREKTQESSEIEKQAHTQEPQPIPLDIPTSSEELQDILRDKKRLEELLAKNPALLAALKAKIS